VLQVGAGAQEKVRAGFLEGFFLFQENVMGGPSALDLFPFSNP